MPTARKPPDMPWIMRRIRSSTGDRVKYIKAMTTPKMKRIMDSAKRGPRRSACMDQKGAAIATKKGVTPEISPAQNAASPGSVTPSSDVRKSGMKATTPMIEIPVPICMTAMVYTIRFQFCIVSMPLQKVTSGW